MDASVYGSGQKMRTAMASKRDIEDRQQPVLFPCNERGHFLAIPEADMYKWWHASLIATPHEASKGCGARLEQQASTSVGVHKCNLIYILVLDIYRGGLYLICILIYIYSCFTLYI